MNTVSVSLDVAQREVDTFIDEVLCLTEDEKAANQATIKKLVSNVCSGHLVIDSSGEQTKIKQYLKKPINDDSGNVFLSEVTYNTRIRAHEIKYHTKSVELQDIDGRYLAVAAAMTEKGASVLGKMLTPDFNLLKAIAGFFM